MALVFVWNNLIQAQCLADWSIGGVMVKVLAFDYQGDRIEAGQLFCCSPIWQQSFSIRVLLVPKPGMYALFAPGGLELWLCRRKKQSIANRETLRLQSNNPLAVKLSCVGRHPVQAVVPHAPPARTE